MAYNDIGIKPEDLRQFFSRPAGTGNMINAMFPGNKLPGYFHLIPKGME
jgi:hypothetical protein